MRIHRYVKIKQNAPEQQIGQRRNHEANYKIIWDKWKQNTMYHNLWDSTKAAIRGEELYSAYIHKKNKYLKSLT